MDLRAVETPYLVEFVRCRFEHPPELDQVAIVGLEFVGCRLPGLNARNLTSKSDLVFADTAVDGLVDLTDADVTGSLTLRGSRFTNYDRVALLAPRVSVGGALLADGLVANGTVSLPAARIRDSFVMRGARLSNVHGPAMVADRAVVAGAVDFHRCESDGAVHLSDLEVAGSLSLTGAVLRRADSSQAPHAVLRLSGARIRDSLRMSMSTIDGLVELDGASVGTDGDLRDCALTSPDEREPALTAENLTVGRDLLLCGEGWRGLASDDSVGWNVLNGPDGRGFIARGPVVLRRAVVGRRLSFDGATLAGRDYYVDVLDLVDLRVAELELTVGAQPRGRVNLRKTRCEALTDNERLWLAVGGLDLAEFRYEALGEPIDQWSSHGIRRRLEWLARALPDYQPGPYDQLISVLRAAGAERHATRVQIVKQRRYYAALADTNAYTGWLVRLVSFVLRTCFGYGYRISRTLVFLLGCWVLGTVWFAVQDPPQLIRSQERWPWDPGLYTLDLLLPVVDLGNSNRWTMTGVSQGVAVGLTVLGWVLVTTIAAEVFRILRRPDPAILPK